MLTFAATLAVAGSASATPTGKVIASPCLNFHNGPSGSATMIGCIPDGLTIPIYCTAQGNPVSGHYGTETVWDKTSWNALPAS